MYALNKFVWAIVNPAVLGLLALVGGFLLSGRKFRRALTLSAVLWLVFWMLPVTTDFIGAPLESPYLVGGGIPDVGGYPEADAIVVLGGGMSMMKGVGGACHAEMNANADRVWQGARLFKSGKAPKIILTSGGVDKSTLPLLVEMGVDPTAVEFHEEPRNTEEEARLLATGGVKRILLVTSAWHMRRAELMFRRYAPEVEIVPAPADWEFTVRERSWDDEHGFGYLKRFQPEAESFWRNTVAFKEWLGYLGYKLFR